MTTPVTEAQLRGLKVGDELRFVWGWETIPKVEHGSYGFNVALEKYRDRNYDYAALGSYHGSINKSPFDILEIRPAKEKRCGEITWVVWLENGLECSERYITRALAVKEAKYLRDICSQEILAITNKTAWSAGDGLELLEGGE